jgi:hypothetical protein
MASLFCITDFKVMKRFLKMALEFNTEGSYMSSKTNVCSTAHCCKASTLRVSSTIAKSYF